MKALFSKAERFLIKNNRCFVIPSDEDNQKISDKDEKQKTPDDFEFEEQGQRFIDLLNETGISREVESDPSKVLQPAIRLNRTIPLRNIDFHEESLGQTGLQIYTSESINSNLLHLEEAKQHEIDK